MADEKQNNLERARWRISFGDFGYIEGDTELEFADELFVGVVGLPCVQERMKRETLQPELTLVGKQ